MLKLLQMPRWLAATPQDLPDNLPGWTVAFLALQPDWVSRERLAALLWPDAGGAEALNNLRANLHRAKALLTSWGAESMLQAERRRVRLDLPTDVAELRQALTARDWKGSLSIYARPLLDGMCFPGFPALAEWFELERAELRSQWRALMLDCIGADDMAPQQQLELTQRMLALDPLDEEALARHVGALVRTGRAGDAAHAYIDYRERLSSELGVAPSLGLQKLVDSLAGVTVRGEPDAPEAVPPRHVFVGRAIELNQLRAMLRQTGGRLVTLCGPGGVGKSRLARELCDSLASGLRDGACWVALSEVVDLDTAFARIAAGLGATLTPARDFASQVARALAMSDRLMVLDDAEQVCGLAPWLSEQLTAAPGVRWLVSSRTLLDIRGERRYSVEGLAFPGPQDEVATVAQARAFDAIRLLESRVRALNPAFDLAAQLPGCVALVRRFEGWPLAIEIAATALAAQPAADVLSDLNHSLDTLAAARPPRDARHHSVRASLQLSWGLLTPSQKLALGRLSVSRGGFARAAALKITQADGAVIAALIDRRLVQIAGGGRLELHPLVAQFAAEQLACGAEEEVVARDLHARYYLELLRTISGPNRTEAGAVARIVESDFENFRAAWRWGIEHLGAASIGPAAAAWTHLCNIKGRAREVAALIEPALSVAGAGGAAFAQLAQALANARYRTGGIDDAIALAREAARAADTAGDAVTARGALNVLALALVHQGNVDEAERHATEALTRARDVDAKDEVAQLVHTRALVARNRGDLETAASMYQDAIAMHRRLGNQRGLAMSLNNLGNVWRARDNLPEAQRSFEECLRVCEQHGLASTRAFALGNLGIVAYETGRLEAARSFAQRALDEPAAEPATILGAHALHARAAVDQSRLTEAAESVRRLTLHARGIGLRTAMFEAIVCHARLLSALGRRTDAAEHLSFVCGYSKTSVPERQVAAKVRDELRLTSEELTTAELNSKRLDVDVLLDAAARAGL